MAPQSHPLPTQVAEGCPTQKGLDMSWLNKAFTLPCQGSSKGLTLSQITWGFLQSHWRKAVPLAQHSRSSQSRSSLLWVTSWGCTSFPTNHTNHRCNLKICWSLTTAWWAHSLSTCPLPPASDSSTYRQVRVCLAQGEVGVTFRVTPWSVERNMFSLWVLPHSRRWSWSDIEMPGSYSRWFTVTFIYLTSGQQIPLIPLHSAWKTHCLWPRCHCINSEKKAVHTKAYRLTGYSYRLQRDGTTKVKWLVLLCSGESCPLWIHVMCTSQIHGQGPTLVQVLTIKKIHVTTELSGYLLGRGLKLLWFRSISFYTRGKILNGPHRGSKALLDLHPSGWNWGHVLTALVAHLTGHISELRTDRSSHDVVQLLPPESLQADHPFFSEEMGNGGWWQQSCPNSQTPLPSSPHGLLLWPGLTEPLPHPPAPSPPPLPLLHHQQLTVSLQTRQQQPAANSFLLPQFLCSSFGGRQWPEGLAGTAARRKSEKELSSGTKVGLCFPG